METRSTLAAHFRYLDSLRDSGQTNMFGAAPYLAARFCIERERARESLTLWMKSDLDKTPEERAEICLIGLAEPGLPQTHRSE